MFVYSAGTDSTSTTVSSAETLLNLTLEKASTQILMHYLMCLSYLGIDKFRIIKEEIKFDERIKKFEEEYKNDKDIDEINKNNVLSLSFALFHTGKSNIIISNENFSNPNEPLNFECFKDEVS